MTDTPETEPERMSFSEMSAVFAALPTILPGMAESAASWHTFAASIPWFSKVTGVSVETLWHMPALTVISHMQVHIKHTLLTPERMTAIGHELQLLGEMLAPQSPASTQEA